MKNIKKILVPFLCLVALVMSLALTSCGECAHVWGEWTATGEVSCGGQTEERVCSECGEKETRNDGGAHTYGAWTVTTPATCTDKGTEERVCTGCQNKETREIAAGGHTENGIVCEYCLTPIYKAPDIDYTKWDSIGAKLNELEVVIDDYDDPEYSGKLTMQFAELYVTLKENNEPYGYGKLKMTMANDQVNNVMDACAYIDGYVLYVAAEGAIPETDENELMYQYIVIDLEKVPELSKVFETLAYLEEEENQETVNTFAEALPKWIEEKLLPIFADAKLPEVDAKRTAEIAKFVNGFYKVEKVGELTAVSVNYDKIKEWNATLATKTVAEFIDIIAGEGFTAKLEALLSSDDLYNYSVADLINHIQVEQKIDLIKLLDAADALLVILTENEEITLEMLLAEQMGAELPDLSTYLTNEDVLKMSVKDALLMYMAVEDADAAVAAAKEMVAPAFEQLKTIKLYAAIVGDDGEDDDAIVAVKEEIDKAIDEVKGQITVVDYFDAAKKFVKAVVETKIPVGRSAGVYMMADVAITVTTEKITVAMEFDQDGQKITESLDIIPGYKVAVDEAKLADIKAMIAKAPAKVTKEILTEYLADRYYWAIKADEVNNKYYLISVNYGYQNYDIAGAPAGTTTWEIHFEVRVIDYSTYAGLSVSKGCGSLIGLSYLLPAERGSLTLNIYADQSYSYYYDALQSCNKDEIVNMIINTKPDGLYDDSYSVDFVYDTANGQVASYYNYRDGHEYELIEDKSIEATGCIGMGKKHYECKNCDAEYDDYYTDGHEAENVYTAANGGYYITQKCKKCNEDLTVGEAPFITINTTLAHNAYSTDNISGIAFTVTESKFYVISADEDNGFDTYCDLYMVNPDGEIVQVTSNDDGGPNMQFYIEHSLTAGVTYIVKPRGLSRNQDLTFSIEESEMQLPLVPYYPYK